jgi:chromosome segregation ATPase
MIVDHAAAARRADERNQRLADGVQCATAALLERVAAVEATQADDKRILNGLVEDVESQEMDGERQARLENRVAVLEKQLVNIAYHRTTAADRKALLDSMQHQLDQTEARLAQYARRLADSDVNLQDCMDRIVAMEKVWQH